ncbi:hypothetical protein VTN02DRAFT_3752 [Thermoascus thermophilus]
METAPGPSQVLPHVTACARREPDSTALRFPGCGLGGDWPRAGWRITDMGDMRRTRLALSSRYSVRWPVRQWSACILVPAHRPSPMLSQPARTSSEPRRDGPTSPSTTDSVTPVNLRPLQSLLPVTGSVARPARTIESRQPVFSSSGRPPLAMPRAAG